MSYIYIPGIYILRIWQFYSKVLSTNIQNLYVGLLQDERSHLWKFVFVSTGPECGGQEGRNGASPGLQAPPPDRDRWWYTQYWNHAVPP